MEKINLAPCVRFKAAIVLIAAASLFTMCKEVGTKDTTVLPPSIRLETPTASPASGPVAPGMEITLSATGGAEIYYTLGSGDLDDIGILYSEDNKPIITEESVLRAIAKKEGMLESAVMTEEYNIFQRSAEGTANLMTLFNVAGTGTAAVTETFNAVSGFVKIAQTKAKISELIHTGDYIDLPSLTVTGYDGTEDVVNNGDADYGYINTPNADITPEELPFDGYEGKLLRIIVVGINSFSTIDSTNTSYNVTENDGTPHIVFQFQNIPGMQKMSPEDGPGGTAAGGYAESMMRKYLVPVEGAGGSGNFLAGLVSAGVPASVLWGPQRKMSVNASVSVNTIEDIVWLPTLPEIFLNPALVSLAEIATNQTHLEYYGSDAKRIKYDMNDMAELWWEATYKSSTEFRYTDCDGKYTYGYASDSLGCAPAFCVK
jgi:hypothetical protein